MKYYDYFFYRIYKSINVTNKSIPEWSTIIVISVLLTMNFISAALFFELKIEKIGGYGFKAIPLTFIALNYMYFLFKDRYKCIIKTFNNTKYKKSIFYDLLILSYYIVSVFVYFHFLGIEYTYSLALVFVVILTSLYGYIRSKE